MEEIRQYLRNNIALRDAIGVGGEAILAPHHLGTGEHNLNYWFQTPDEQKFVLRINVAAQPFHKNQVAYEFAALRTLETSGCTPIPIYLDDSAKAPGKGIIVESFCKGRTLDFDHLQPGDSKCAIALMAHVHAVPLSEECLLYKPTDPLQNLFSECLKRFAVYRSSAFENVRLTRWVEQLISKAENALKTHINPHDNTHLINTEPLPSHFLIASNTSSKLRGFFLDWERPIIGEVAQDLAYFTSPTTTFWDSNYLMPSDEASRLVEEYWNIVDGRFPRGNFDARFQAFRIMTALRSITWCCRALITYHQPGTHTTQRTIEKLPFYLSDDFLNYLMP